MTKPLTAGIKAFRRNIRDMKKIGREADKRRALQAMSNTDEHLQRMSERAETAAAEKARRAAEGVSRRDAHNAMLASQRAEREQRRNSIKIGHLA